MAKLYNKKTVSYPKMTPKWQTINFILNYSKALTVVKIGTQNFEVISN